MKSLAELQAIREKTRLQLNLRHESPDNVSVKVGLATCGIEAGAREVICAFVDELEKRGIENVTVTAMGCIDKCDKEPVAVVEVPGEEKVTYVNMTPEKAVRVIEEHIVNKKVVAEYTDGATV